MPGNSHCLVFVCVRLSMCVCMHVHMHMCVYYLHVAQSVFIELLPVKTKGGARCTQDTRADWCVQRANNFIINLW